MNHESFPRLKKTPFGLLAGILLVALFEMTAPNRATAQMRMSQVPEHLIERQPANLYVDFAGSESFDGVLVALPASWTLSDARFVSESGSTYPTTRTAVEEYPNRVLIRPRDSVSKSDRLILTVLPSGASSGSALSVIPIRLPPGPLQRSPEVLQEFRVRTDLPVIESPPTASGMAADFSEDDELRPSIPDDRLPPFRESDPFTVELWMRTTSFEEIVLSSWDGDEETPYPLELVVDGSGHIVSYQGTAGHHVSMRSRHPVADGFWHHVAVTHDPADGWTRMFMDGIATDSLRHSGRIDFGDPAGVRLGHRLPTRDGLESLSEYIYTGRLDELRIWSESRSAELLREYKRREVRPDGSLPLVLSFEPDEELTDRLEIPTSRSSLSSSRPIEDLSLQSVAGGVRLSWDAPDPSVEAFVVETSTDGRRYSEVARIEASSATGNSFSFLDDAAGEGVRYYRIREVLGSGNERTSAPVKAGLGGSEKERTAVLAGNFPNPFNPSTQVSFTVRESQHVRVSVWDLAGQLVSVLVDETVGPGYHQVSFDADGLPSGTYFARMQTAEGIQTHQMVLMK